MKKLALIILIFSFACKQKQQEKPELPPVKKVVVSNQEEFELAIEGEGNYMIVFDFENTETESSKTSFLELTSPSFGSENGYLKELPSTPNRKGYFSARDGDFDFIYQLSNQDSNSDGVTDLEELIVEGQIKLNDTIYTLLTNGIHRTSDQFYY